MPPKIDFSDDSDLDTPAATVLPVKTKPLQRPSRDQLAAASAVAEDAGFKTRSTTGHVDPSVPMTVTGRPRRKPGRPKGPKSERITLELYADDLAAFINLCDGEWEGVPYKVGFRKLLDAYKQGQRRGN